LGNEGFVRINALITKLLTASIAKMQRIDAKTGIPKQ
jgi:hypothetical protein